MFQTIRGREKRGGPAASPARWLQAALFVCGVAALLFPNGCAREPKDAVVSIKGWSMNLAGLQAEYDRVKGSGSFATASVQDRESFARTLADKEILLRAAHRRISSLTGKQARIYRITYEKALQRDYLKYRRDLFKLTDDQVAQNLPLVSRIAQMRVARLPSKEAGAQVHAAQEAGDSFEQIAEKYAVPPQIMPGSPAPPPGTTPPKWQEVTVRIDDPRSPPSLIMQGLLRNLPEGGMSPPIEGQGNVFFAKVQKYQPLDGASDPGFAAKVKPRLEDIGYMNVNNKWVDSLRTALKLDFHRESYPIILQRMATFWDSLDTQRLKNVAVDYQGLRAPIWLFTAEERRQPCFDLGGKTWTVGDFVESLNNIDLDYWPTVGDLSKISFQTDGRIFRLFFQTEAEKTGFQKMPAFAEKMKKVEEECYLNQLFDELGTKETEARPEEIKADYDASPTGYSKAERIAFSFLTYPPSKEARARATLARLRAGGPLLWFDLAPAEQKADTTIKYQPPTDLMDTSRPAPVGNWTPFMEAAKGTDPGHISDLIRTPAGFSIVRTQEREPAQRMTLEEATPFIRGQVQNRKKEALIDKLLTEERKRNGLKVHIDRLGQPETAPNPAKAEAKPGT